MNLAFCDFSRLILKLTVPMVAVQAAYLIYYIISRDMFAVFAAYDIVVNIIQSVLMSLLLSIGGCLFMDFLERNKLK